jgi:hypothetical protein
MPANARGLVAEAERDAHDNRQQPATGPKEGGGMNKKQQQENILNHGLRLQRLYPETKERQNAGGFSAGPVSLCKALHRLEAEAHRYTEQLCNGPEISEADQEKKEASILARVKALLGAGPEVILNRDPRGYALKIDTENAKNLDIYKDWGGYGILCPEF